MKSGPIEMTMEDAFCDPNSQNQLLHFVTEGGRKRVYPDETADVKADSDIAPACHTKIKSKIKFYFLKSTIIETLIKMQGMKK